MEGFQQRYESAQHPRVVALRAIVGADEMNLGGVGIDVEHRRGLRRAIQAQKLEQTGQRALAMLQSAGWISAHRFLFASLRQHLLGWPRSLAPDGRRAALGPAAAPA